MTFIELTREQAEETVAAVERHGNITRAAKALGLTRPTVQNRLRRAQILYNLAPSGAKILSTEPKAPATPLPLRDPPEWREVKRLREDAARLRAQVKELQDATLSSEDIRKYAFSLGEASPEVPDWCLSTGRSSGVTGVPSVIWSDWHLGEVVRREELHGLNEFSLPIAERRIVTLVGRVVDLCLNHMTSPQYPGIVVNLIGDIVSGNIHDELVETNEAPLYPVILWAYGRLIWALQQLLNKFGKVLVVCSPGNHGRNSRRPRAKQAAANNADWLLYCLLEKWFEANPDIHFINTDSGEALYSVYHHRYLAMHGDRLGVKGGDGIIGAIGPIIRGEIKVGRQAAQVGRDYETLLLGHWHQMLWLPRCIVNNTLKGYDEYAHLELRAPHTPPAQALWFTHPRHGITARWEIQLEEQGQDVEHNWASWPAEQE